MLYIPIVQHSQKKIVKDTLVNCITEQVKWSFLLFLTVIVLQSYMCMQIVLLYGTDYGRTMNPFFIEIPNFWAWANNLGRYILGHFWYFRPILVLWVPWIVHVFYNQSLYLQKTKPLYPHPKYLFGIGIWIWAAKN